MHTTCFVRVGAFGHVGRFVSLDGRRYRRGDRVVCRTLRGLEVGDVLGLADSGISSRDAEHDMPRDLSDGDIVRGVTPEDDLLLVRLNQKRQQAIASCESLLSVRGVPVSLVEVEQTFDGETLVFYFLGEMSPAVEAITSELATTYEQSVQMKQFAQLLEEGCGPGCGTENAEGCGTGCASCAVACGLKRDAG